VAWRTRPPAAWTGPGSRRPPGRSRRPPDLSALPPTTAASGHLPEVAWQLADTTEPSGHWSTGHAGQR
jgi:hypothetical protein